MNVEGISALVTGGSSGLGEAVTRRLVAAGASVVIVDLAEPREPVDGVVFIAADITDEAGLRPAFDAADANGPLRAVIHCAGRGGDQHRVLARDGSASPLESFESIIRTNLVGSYNVLRLAAERMAATEPVDGERGCIVLTASIAAWDGQVGQTSYAASKAGVAGMTLVAARDLASLAIRVNTIAPGVFATPMTDRFDPAVMEKLAAAVPFPKRLGVPEDYARLAIAVLENEYLNGETIRLDGAVRMPPR